MSRLLPARYAPPRYVPERWGGAVTSVTTIPELVESPTRVTRPKRVGTVGDALVFNETLMGADGTPQDLTGATVTFTFDGPAGEAVVVAQPATIKQNGDTQVGQVTYKVKASVAVPEGVCSWKFKARWDADTALSFPDGAPAIITMYADIDEE